MGWRLVVYSMNIDQYNSFGHCYQRQRTCNVMVFAGKTIFSRLYDKERWLTSTEVKRDRASEAVLDQIAHIKRI